MGTPHTTAVMALTSKSASADGQTMLQFHPNYSDPRNKEWAKYTPAASLGMTVLDSVADRFEVGDEFVLEFHKREKSEG